MTDQKKITRAYHHGELKSALIAATDQVIDEEGIEAFSLRKVARRAGVSPGAPAHHFGSAKGLLTEVAILGYRTLKVFLDRAPTTGSPQARLRALAEQYVRFALDKPGRFRLMFRKDLVDRNDPRYYEAGMLALGNFGGPIADLTGIPREERLKRKEFAPVLAVWATAHGIASLALEEKMVEACQGDSPSEDFVQRVLPAILHAQWPD